MPPPNIPVFQPESAEGGSVGHLISAAMQTAGFMFQSDVIQSFGGVLTQLGLLFFVVGALGTIGGYIIFGKAKYGLYLLVSVALFSTITFVTTPASPTLLQVGKRVHGEATGDQLKMLESISGRNFTEERVKVSWFFSLYDRLISSLTQTLVSFLIDEDNRRDLIATARERAVTEILSSTFVEQEFINLLGVGLMGECSRYSFLKRELGSIEEQLANPITHAPRRTELIALRGRYTNEIDNLKLVPRPLDTALANYLFYHFSDRPFSAPPTHLNCEEIWRFTWERAKQLAEEQIQRSTNNGVTDDNGIPWGTVRDEVLVLAGEGDPEEAVRVIAARIYRHTLRDLPMAKFAEHMVSRGGVDPAKYELALKPYARGLAESHFVVLQFFSGIIPYVQGFILFCLSAAFPFFALLLLFPSRAGGFLVWLGLWVWAKSWDIGFAAIGTARDILWALLSPGIRPQFSGDWEDLSFLFQAANYNDPMANLTIYYLIISLLMVSVPFLSAHLCLGGTEAFDVFKNMINETALRVQSRAAKGVFRNYADIAEAKGFELESRFGLQQARAEALNRGGNLVGTNTPRYLVAGGKMARNLQGVSDSERNRFHFSPESIQQRGILAMFSSRPITQSGSGSVSNNETNRIADLAAEPYDSPTILQAHGNLFAGVFSDNEQFLASSKHPNQRTSTGKSSTPARDMDSD
jgi:hypothetical protein